jgi:N-acetylmuramoyl-L-alanine amidase
MPTDPAIAMPPAILDTPLPYVARLQARPLAQVELVVIHCTELPDLAIAREYGERVLYPDALDPDMLDPERGTGNSGHFYIDRDGAIHRWVPEDRIAHHVRGHNPHSIGIELVNTGRWPRWLDAAHQAMDEPYPDAQVDALVALLRHLRATLPALRDIAGHEDLDRDRVPATDDPAVMVARKRDPGPLFPWEKVLAAVPLRRAGTA